jgi:spore germination protein GerM
VAVGVAAGVLTVDVTGSTAGAPTDEVATQVAQIVLTATSLADVTSVVLVRDGEPVPVPRADGVTTTAPVTARDFQSLVSTPDEP